MRKQEIFDKVAKHDEETKDWREALRKVAREHRLNQKVL